MRVSFIIPVRNDAGRLEGCLRSIRTSRYAETLIEVVVADNGSTDGSGAVAAANGATVLSLPSARLGVLRNQAAAVATGDVLAFVDSDHEIAPDWVPAALEALAHEHVGAVGAAYTSPRPATWVQRLYDRLRPHAAGQREVDWLGSGNMAVTRNAFERVGGFDASLQTCEDVDLCRKLRAHGFRLLADSRLHNIHHGDPPTLRHVFLGELWRGRDNVRVSLRRPWSWRTLASAAIPLFNLIALTVAVIGLASAARPGVIIGSAAAVSVGSLISLRASRMIHGGGSPRDLPGAFAVAAAYELGRALALAARVGHARRRGAPA